MSSDNVGVSHKVVCIGFYVNTQTINLSSNHPRAEAKEVAVPFWNTSGDVFPSSTLSYAGVDKPVIRLISSQTKSKRASIFSIFVDFPYYRYVD